MTSAYAVDHTSEYLDDPEAVRFVADHPDGGDRHAVARAFRLSPERIRQIEAHVARRLAYAVWLAKLVEPHGITNTEAWRYLRDEWRQAS